MRLISQFISGISRVLQKLLKYFNGTAISAAFFVFVFLLAFFLLSLLGVFPVIFILNLNDLDCVILSCRSSL